MMNGNEYVHKLLMFFLITLHRNTVQRSSVNIELVVVYRSGSKAATLVFLDEFLNLTDYLAVYAAPVVLVGDLNLNLDDHQRRLQSV